MLSQTRLPGLSLVYWHLLPHSSHHLITWYCSDWFNIECFWILIVTCGLIVRFYLEGRDENPLGIRARPMTPGSPSPGWPHCVHLQANTTFIQLSDQISEHQFIMTGYNSLVIRFHLAAQHSQFYSNFTPSGCIGSEISWNSLFQIKIILVTFSLPQTKQFFTLTWFGLVNV